MANILLLLVQLFKWPSLVQDLKLKVEVNLPNSIKLRPLATSIPRE